VSVARARARCAGVLCARGLFNCALRVVGRRVLDNDIDGAGAAVADTFLRSLKLNFVLRALDGIDDFGSPPLEAELACHYRVPHVRCIVRTRVMCQAGRARAAGARGDIVAWLCERAPLWVVVHVCALLR
jgi:hypothetical protein